VLYNGESQEPMLRALTRGFQLGLDAELVIARKLEEAGSAPCWSGAKS
jgi:ubiquinone biosynthesis protein COQ4